MIPFPRRLAQGAFLLPFWSMECSPMVGPAPDSSSHPNANRCPLLSIELPELGTALQFPEKIPPVLYSESHNFEDLDEMTKQQLTDICSQDLMTFTGIPLQEREILWEKRHYLKNVPGALPKVLLAAHSWDDSWLPRLYGVLEGYTPPQPMDILQLFLPCFPDIHVREVAIKWLSSGVSNDDLTDFLPQLLEALKHETWTASSLAKLLLQRSLESPRLAHSLYWLLTQSLPGSAPQNSTFTTVDKSNMFQLARYERRLRMMMRALETICGESLRNAFLKQQVLLKVRTEVKLSIEFSIEFLFQYLHDAAEDVKTCSKDGLRSVILKQRLEQLNLHLKETPTPVPLSLGFEANGINVEKSSYFPSNSVPLKIAFSCGEENANATDLFGIFKVGDDLRQDQLTLQAIRIMDKLWLKDGMDMKMVTFGCVPTGSKEGIMEMVTESKTLREIQVAGNKGVTGCFVDTAVAEWLKIHNPSTFDISYAIDNFTKSCAGYSIVTYLLGICDRHNDNIMVKKSGHLFHIDFGKFLGDAQMFAGTIKRDRTPFVLTPDMAYVINGFEKTPTQKFLNFVDLCCKGFNVLRRNGNVLLNLFSLVSKLRTQKTLNLY